MGGKEEDALYTPFRKSFRKHRMAQACNPSARLKIWLSNTTETVTNTVSAVTIMKTLHRNPGTVILQKKKIWIMLWSKQSFHLHILPLITAFYYWVSRSLLRKGCKHSLGGEWHFRESLTQTLVAPWAVLVTAAPPSPGYPQAHAPDTQKHRSTGEAGAPANLCKQAYTTLGKILVCCRAPFPDLALMTVEVCCENERTPTYRAPARWLASDTQHHKQCSDTVL